MVPALLEMPSMTKTSVLPSKLFDISTIYEIADLKNTKPDYEEALLHRSLIEHPHNVTSGPGLYLNLRDGRQVIDACGGAAVAIIGNGGKEVMRASTAQMMKVSYVHTISYSTGSAQDLAHCLLDGNPYMVLSYWEEGRGKSNNGNTDGLENTYFVGSGSEAIDAAIKLARQYFFEQGQTQRKHFISRQQGYHGNSIGSTSISANLTREDPHQDALTLPNVSQVSPA